MMNNVMKEKWIAALRSGKYKQGVRLLENGELNCCLGVLCHVAGLERIVHKTKLMAGFSDPTGALTNNITLSMKFQQDMNISNKEQLHLISLNDDVRLSFNEIADWIERNL